MKTFTTTAIIVATLAAVVDAFTTSTSPMAFSATTTTTATSSSPSSPSSSALFMGYVPSGFTPEQYKKFKDEEAKKNATKKNLGGVGPKGFKSRSFQSFQEALERGEATHLLPVMNAKERVRKGELKLEDIPYMQRGGSWDDSDVKGAKKKRWLSSDKEYANGGYRKEQSVSIFGVGEGLDWTGTRARSRPESAIGAAPKFGRNYKAPNVNEIKTKAVTPAKSKPSLFGAGNSKKAAAPEEQPKKKFGWW